MERTTVQVPQRLVVENRQEFSHQVEGLMQRGVLEITLDFSHTGYIDASGLGSLVSLQKRNRERGGAGLELTSMNRDLRTLFDLTKLDTLFRVL